MENLVWYSDNSKQTSGWVVNILPSIFQAAAPWVLSGIFVGKIKTSGVPKAHSDERTESSGHVSGSDNIFYSKWTSRCIILGNFRSTGSSKVLGESLPLNHAFTTRWNKTLNPSLKLTAFQFPYALFFYLMPEWVLLPLNITLTLPKISLLIHT